MPRCCPGDDLVLFASAIAISLSRNRNPAEINILANLFAAVGDNLAIIAAKREACEPQQPAENGSSSGDSA
jgi:hypothetical protein